jgi:hypothetical protein
MESFDLQPWTRIGAMNLGVAARRQTAAVSLGGKFAVLCRDAATGPRFMGRENSGLLPRFRHGVSRGSEKHVQKADKDWNAV